MILSVQYMRAVAALLVLVTHAATKGAQYSDNPLGWFNVGSLGVDLFFIISGFIMCHTTDNKNVNFGYFMKARFIRIIPLYWFLTTVALIGFILFPEKINSSGGNTNIIHSYTLFPSEDKYLINNGWTLSYEFFFYFIFGAGLYFSGIQRRFFPAALIILLVIAGSLFGVTKHITGFITNPLLLDFVLGILAFEMLKQISYKKALAIVCLPVSILLVAHVNFNGGVNIRMIDYGIPAFLFFIGMLNLEPLFVKFDTAMVSKIFRNIGDSSYSLYLLHPFVLVACALIFHKSGLSGHGYLFVALLIICSIIAGHLCFLFIEKTLLRTIRKIGRLRVQNA